MRPAVQALLDQADAATREALGLITAFADASVGEMSYTAQGGPAAEIVARLAERATRRGQLTACPHLYVGGGPVPLHWIPARPGRLRCLSCAVGVLTGFGGTAEDATCDRCRKHRPGAIHPEMLMIPAAVLDLPEHDLLTASGPVLMHFGLCGDCDREQDTYRRDVEMDGAG